MQNYFKAMRHSLDFRGRASRSEYWLFHLVLISLLAVYGFLFLNYFGVAIAALIVLIHLLPLFAVSVRRLHDIGASGWWFLIWFTAVGQILLLILSCMRSANGPNEYGPHPNDNDVAPEMVETGHISAAESPQGAAAPHASHAIDTASTPRAGDIVAQLGKLSDLHAEGVIDPGEFARLKAALIAKLD